jgi:hypothetical protein
VKFAADAYFHDTHRRIAVGSTRPASASPAAIAGRRRLMSPQERIEALRARHAALERAIDEESSHPFPNQETISDLKRQKLRIKDELAQLERQ